MALYYDVRHTVSAEEIDAQGHVHNLRYLQWTLWAADRHTAAVGFDAKSALQAGFGWVVRNHDATYKSAALAGDELVVRTWVSQWDRFSSRRQYVVARPSDKSVLARVTTRWVYVDLNVRRVVPIPDDVKAMMTLCSSPPPLPWEDE